MPNTYPFSRAPRKLDATAADARYRLRWGSIAGGVLAALLAYAILMALALAVGGAGAEGVARGATSLAAVGIGSALWITVAVLLALAAGGYVTGRSAGLVPVRLARMQAVVMAGLFFGALALQAQVNLGGMGDGLGKMVSSINASPLDLARTEPMQEIFDDAIGDLTLKSPTETVATGLATRLLRGKDGLALSLLAREGNISRSEAQRRIENVKARFDQLVMDAQADAADAVEIAGWSAFIALFLGTAFAVMGADYGAQRNMVRVDSEDAEVSNLLESAA